MKKLLLFTLMLFCLQTNAQTAEECYDNGIEKAQAEDYKGAMADFTKAIEKDASIAKYYLARGKAQSDLEQDKEALIDFDKAIALKGDDPEIFYARGISYVMLEDYETGIKDFSKAIELDSEFADAYYYRGHVRAYLDQDKEAIEDFTEAIKLNDGYAYKKRAVSRYHLSDFPGALEDLTEAIKFDPEDVDAYNYRGIIYNKMGEFEKAVADFTSLIELGETSAYYSRGVINGKLDKHKEAIADYTEAIKVTTNNGLIYNNRADEKNKLGDYKGAIVDATKAIELVPESFYPYFCRGYAMCKLGQDGCVDLNKAIDLGDDTQEIKDVMNEYCTKGNKKDFYALGVAKLKAEDYKAAITDLNKALKKDAKNALAYYYRGLAKYALDDYKNAQKDFSKAIELDPSEAGFYYRLATAQTALEEYAPAIKALTKAIEVRPDFSVAMCLRGHLYFALEDKIACCEDFAAAKALGDKEAEEYYPKYCGNEQQVGESLMLYWPEEENWRMANNQENDEMSSMELLRNMETFDNWTEIATMQAIKGATNVPMDEAMGATYTASKKTCKDAVLTMIEKNDKAEHPWVIFSIESGDCKDGKAVESQVWYIIQGKDALYMNFRAIKAGTIPAATKTKWVNFFKTGKIMYLDEEKKN